MKKTVILAICALMLGAGSASAVSDWAESEAQAANRAGLVTESLLWGSVTENITREEFCYLAMNLYKNMGGDIPQKTENPFSDTKNSAVSEAYTLGIINGKEETLFYPKAPITRQEIAKVIMLTVNNLTGSGVTQKAVCEVCRFEDFDEIDSWATEYINDAVKHNLMNGVSETRLSPQGNATREQAIVLMMRAYDAFSDAEAEYSVPRIASLSAGEKLADRKSVV